MNQVRIQMRQVTREARLPEPVPASPWLNPTQLDRPSFLLSFPFSYSTRVANNPWMQDLPPDRRQPDFKRATVQFLELYRYLAGDALLYQLPTPRRAALEDLRFTATPRSRPCHLPDKDI